MVKSPQLDSAMQLMSNGKAINMESIGDLVGGWGPWQLNVFLLDLSIQMISTMNALSTAFMAPQIDFWCDDTSITSNGSLVDSYKQCSASVKNITTPCKNWKYDTSFFTSTIISEWDVVCDSSWLSSFSASLYMIGYFFSSLLSGHLSDRFGRLPVLWASVIIELIAGFGCAFSNSVVYFLISRFILAAACYAKFLTGFTLLMENAGSNYRTTYGVLSRAGRSLGHIVLPIVAWYFRDFRHLQLAITIPGIGWLFWLTKIYESPRWLIVNNKLEKAAEVLSKAAKMNGKEVPYLQEKLFLIKKSIEENSSSINNPNFLDLWKTKRLRLNTSVMSFNWFATVFIYYALSFNVQSLGGNLFHNFIISGLVELPSLALSIYALKKIGRKVVLTVSQVGIFLAFALVIPTCIIEFDAAVKIRVFLSMFGKFCATCSFAINYILSSEIYPTCVRQIGVGTNSAAGRLGSMMSPFIKELNSHLHPAASFSIFSVLASANAFLIQLLPETKDKDIPDTIDQVESGQLWKTRENYSENHIKQKLKHDIDHNGS